MAADQNPSAVFLAGPMNATVEASPTRASASMLTGQNSGARL